MSGRRGEAGAPAAALALLPALAFVVAAALPSAGQAAVARRGAPVMGTILTVTVVADGSGLAGRLADEAIAECRRWDDTLTIWREDGELARFNAAAGSGTVAVSPRLHAGLVAMREMAIETGGAFEPGVAVLPNVGDAGAKIVGVARALQIEPGRASLLRGAVLDPGAIGKGLALDAAVRALREGGAHAAFLDFGGSSQTAVGIPPGDASGWKVEVPGLVSGSNNIVLSLRDESVSTSRAGATDTKPILDPRTGLPVPVPRLATVRAKQAARADAWSTALVVLGPGGLGEAPRHGVEALLETAGGAVRTSGFSDSPARP